VGGRRSDFIADAHRDDGQRFIERADEKLTAFVELESAIREAELDADPAEVTSRTPAVVSEFIMTPLP
jgi:hypothetical protein